LLIQTSKTQVITKRRAGSKIVNLTPNQKKSGIDSIYLAVDDVQHTIGKLSTKTTTLLETAPRFEVYSQNYGWGSKVAGILAGVISKLPFRSFEEKKPFGCRLRGQSQSIL
jgi:hypothetical protein